MAGWDDSTKKWGTPRANAPSPYSVGGGPGVAPPPPSEVNPYDKPISDTYDAAMKAASTSGNDYDAAIDAANKGLADAGTLVGKDYTAELNRMAQEEIAKQQQAQANQFRSLGMGELSLRTDVQDDWAATRTDAATKAAIDAQAMQAQALAAQQAALASLTATISAASGDELDALALALQAASAGGSNYNQYAEFNAGLLAEGGAPNTTGGNRQTGVI